MNNNNENSSSDPAYLTADDINQAHSGGAKEAINWPALSAMVLVIAALMAGGVALLGNLDQAPDDSIPEQVSDARLKARAYLAIKDAVLNRLKAPATANFGPYSDASLARVADGRYVVASYVDSQNTFGANIRTRFVGTARDIGGGEFVVDDIAFEQR
ncbi:hypothetical protein [Salinisphaera sp. T31B1]|uniref:hypothetical protein n=1 Tax=Salinisphaera sp. T31B1 TaxID=727963 RepID=UPI0033424D8B